MDTSRGDDIARAARKLLAHPLIGQAVLGLRHFAILHQYARVKAHVPVAEPLRELGVPLAFGQPSGKIKNASLLSGDSEIDAMFGSCVTPYQRLRELIVMATLFPVPPLYLYL
jgi:hypothetical protein